LKVAILGYGMEGQAAYRYWNKQGADIAICDSNASVTLPDGVKAKLGPSYLEDLDDFDLLVRSPGIRPDVISSSVPITSVTREFMAKCSAPIIGVTGTKGKGTTSTLIAKILEVAGKTVWLGGNIGTPALDFLDLVKPTDCVVLELSSFQLMDVTQSPHIAVCLMVAPDHLDYHGRMDNYMKAKSNIFRFQTTSDMAVYNGNQPEVERLVQLSPGRKIPYGKPDGAYIKRGEVYYLEQKICSIVEVGLLGQHNLENVCAAVAATFDVIGQVQPMAQAIQEFKGLPHRLELVGEVDGVRYINDSFAANPVSAIAALKAFKQSKVVILGGYDRGVDQQELAKAVKTENVRQVILVGQTASKLAQLLDGLEFRDYEVVKGGMDQIVGVAARYAQSGDVVLLSPGSPSFDMFKDFADRGDKYKAAIAALGASQ
jgi:UDP-N-acetylmuramoylalanine--D-glutamate ligase